jgi:hypothetical protein
MSDGTRSNPDELQSLATLGIASLALLARLPDKDFILNCVTNNTYLNERTETHPIKATSAFEGIIWFSLTQPRQKYRSATKQ